MVPPELFPERIEDCGVATMTCRSIDFVVPLCVCYASLDTQQAFNHFHVRFFVLLLKKSILLARSVRRLRVHLLRSPRFCGAPCLKRLAPGFTCDDQRPSTNGSKACGVQGTVLGDLS
jgi:hypothetical protein